MKCSVEVSKKFAKLKEKYGAEIDEIIQDVQSIKDNMIDAGAYSTTTFKDKVKELLKRNKEDNIENMHMIADQLQKNMTIEKRINDPAFKNFEEAVESLYIKSFRKGESSSMNVESEINRMNIEGTNYLEQNLTPADYEIVRSRAYEEEIIEYIASGGKSVPSHPRVEKIAKTLKHLNALSHKNKKDAGLAVGFVEDYVVNGKNLLKPKVMKQMGEAAWVKRAMDDLDPEKTFPLMPEKIRETKSDGTVVEFNPRERYLSTIYKETIKRSDDLEAVDFDNLKDLLKERGTDVKAGVVKKHFQPRKLHWKPEALGKLFKDMNPDKNILESIFADFQRTSRDVAKYTILGKDGDNAIKNAITRRIRKHQESIAELNKQIQQGGDAEALGKKITSLEKQIEKESKPKTSALLSLNNIQKVINGETDRVESEGLASFFENWRSIEIMSKLGGATLSALSDIPTAMHNMTLATGKNYLTATRDMVKSMAEVFPAEKQRYYADIFNIAIESELNSQMRMMGAGSFTGAMAKVNSFYQKLNPIAQQGRFHRIAATTVLSADLAEMSTKGWSDVPIEAKELFKKAGILEEDWEAMKYLAGETKFGRKLLTSAKAEDIPDEVAQAIIAKKKYSSGAMIGVQKTLQYKKDLEKRVSNLFQEFAQDAAPQPGIRERAIITQGTAKGTWPGELMRSIGMLKSFAIKMSQMLQKTYHAKESGADKAMLMTQYVAGLTSFGYASMALSSLSRGETPPDPTNLASFRDAFLKGGAAGLLGDFLLQESAGGRSSVIGFLGPQFSTLSDAKDILTKSVTGDLSSKDINKMFSYVPGNNLFYLRAGLVYSFGDSYRELVSPGHKQRMNRRQREREGLLWRQEKLVR